MFAFSLPLMWWFNAFSVLCNHKLNVYEFRTAGWKKISNLNMLSWTPYILKDESMNWKIINCLNYNEIINCKPSLLSQSKDYCLLMLSVPLYHSLSPYLYCSCSRSWMTSATAYLYFVTYTCRFDTDLLPLKCTGIPSHRETFRLPHGSLTSTQPKWIIYQHHFVFYFFQRL